VARNRKRAKERRARRPEPVISARGERDGASLGEREATPDAMAHATPDVELAEAQLALGRPSELAGESDAEQAEQDYEDFEHGEPEPVQPRGGRGGRRNGPPDGRDGGGGGGSGEGPPAARGGELAGAGASVPAPRTHLVNRLVNFLQGSWRELQRVQWPDRRQVMQATGVVIGFVIVAGVYLGVADTLATKLMNFVLK
jgi:preprotein translocase subunit SecE